MDFKESNKKAYWERKDEKISELEYEIDIKDKKTVKRIVDQKIPSHNLSWLQSNHPELEQPYVNYVGKQATTLNKAANFLSMKYGIELQKEHPISVSGAGDIELTPTTPISDRGPNDQGFAGNARFNNRLQEKNAFKRADLDELGVASNWQYSVANFAADRPDIRDPVERARMKLKPLGPKVSNFGMLKLQQGDLDIDTLRMKMFIEQDLRKSGIELDVDQQANLGKFLLDLENKELALNARKHSYDKKGNPTGEYNLAKHEPHRIEGEAPDGRTWGNQNNKTGKVFDDDAWLTKRVQDSQNAVKRHNPTFTELPSQRTGKTNRSTHLVPNGENGENGTNGKKLNGKVNNGKVTNGKKLLAGSVITGALTNFMPTPSAAKEIYPMIQSGNYGDAAKTYGKDLVVGQSMSRAMGSAVNMLKSKFGKNISKALARKALQIAGRQLVKKGAALATGPAAPIVMTSLLIKDAYDVANALSGGALEPGKPTSTNRKRLRHGRK